MSCTTDRPARLQELFDVGVVVAIADPTAYPVQSYPDGQILLQCAGARRRAEFACGRAMVRAALGLLGAERVLIPQGERGQPVWPAGVVGSITHCDDFCGAVLTRSEQACALGFDAELAEPLSEGLARRVCGDAEILAFPRANGAGPGHWAKVAFSAKEAFYKAFAPTTGMFLDFLDVTIRFSRRPCGLSGTFAIQPSPRWADDRHGEEVELVGGWLLDGNKVFTGISLQNADDVRAFGPRHDRRDQRPAQCGCDHSQGGYGNHGQVQSVPTLASI